jgi:hypothetical protein
MLAAQHALRQALREALAADLPLSNLLEGRLYEVPPKRARFPYLSMGSFKAKPWNTSTETGAEHTIEISIWSDHEGSMQASQIGQRVAVVLDTTPLNAAGLHVVRCDLLETIIRRPRDDSTSRVLELRYRMLTEDVT